MTGRILEETRGRNRATPQEAASFVDKYEEFEAQIGTLRAEFMNRCKAVREQQKDLLDDAKSQGIAKKVVKTIAEARRLEQKAKAKLDDLEDDDRALAVDIRKALGDYADLPLGAAAVEREDPQDPTTAAIVDAASKEWNEAAPASKH